MLPTPSPRPPRKRKLAEVADSQSDDGLGNSDDEYGWDGDDDDPAGDASAAGNDGA